MTTPPPTPNTRTITPRPTRRPRLLALLVALATLAAALFALSGTANAESVVQPNSGPSGHKVYGHLGGSAKSYSTMLFKVSMGDGSTAYMFCTDIQHYIALGKDYTETSWDSSNVANVEFVTAVLHATNATSTLDKTEIAAAQAAIWHFSDGFELDPANPNNSAAVIARYNELVAYATANPVHEEPAPTLDVTPADQSGVEGTSLIYDVTTTAAGPLSLSVDSPAVSIHPVSGGTCDTSSTISQMTGSGQVCLASADPLSGVTLTVTTEAATINRGRVFVRAGNQTLVMASEGIAQSSASATANWTVNQPPAVSVACPPTLVYGEPATFTAVASDDSGLPLTYRWYVNGNLVQEGGSPSLTTAVDSDDEILVEVVDHEGLTAQAAADCAGLHRPQVSIECPPELVYGEPAEWHAVVTDPDSDSHEITWYVDGQPVANGETATLTVQAGQSVSVIAVDQSGLAGGAESECVGNHRPAVTLTCPTDLVYGEPATFTATGSDADGGELTYRWYINGEEVEGETSSTAELTIDEGDVVSVVAVDEHGVASEEAGFSCTGTYPPAEVLPNETQAPSTSVGGKVQTTSGASTGTLAFTGGESRTLALAAAVLLLLGSLALLVRPAVARNKD